MKDIEYPGELLFFSAIAGGIAAPLKFLVHQIFVLLKLATPFYTATTTYLIHGHRVPGGFVESIFAELGDMAVGAVFGIILGLWLARNRPKYHWWIGLGFGFGIWFLSLALGNLTKLIKDPETTSWSLFAHFLSMLTFSALFVLATRVWKPLKERVEAACSRRNWS